MLETVHGAMRRLKKSRIVPFSAIVVVVVVVVVVVSVIIIIIIITAQDDESKGFPFLGHSDKNVR